jgi:hypothetical protein
MRAVTAPALRVVFVNVVAGGLLIGFPAAPLAQRESRILGRVSDVCGAVFPGVTISVNGESHRVAVQTDTLGRFDVQGLPPGIYTVSASTILQRDSGTVPYRDRLATGKRLPVQVGEEYVAFLEDSCRGLWDITLRFPVRNGRVYVPRGEPGYSDEWNGYEGMSVSALIKRLVRLAEG